MMETKLSEKLERILRSLSRLGGAAGRSSTGLCERATALGPQFRSGSRRAGQPPRGESCRSDGA